MKKLLLAMCVLQRQIITNLNQDAAMKKHLLAGACLLFAMSGADLQMGIFLSRRGSAEDKKKIFEGNALRAYPRLKNKLRAKAAARA